MDFSVTFMDNINIGFIKKLLKYFYMKYCRIFYVIFRKVYGKISLP